SRPASAWESMMWRSKAGQMTGVQNGSVMEFDEQLGVHEGVEMIHPFLDREMVDYAFRTPPRLLGTLKNRKRLLGRAMAQRSPDPLWERPKTPSRDLFVERSLRGAFRGLGPWKLWRLQAILPLDADKQELLRRVSAGEPLESPVLAWDMVCREYWLRRNFPEEASLGEAGGLAATA
ncbi:MAG TPA: asparagine synthase-related protein, partial [Thermoanaerobaculia bacterium]|nr:asparagine synthase-related protein [Thermoanaerobaculia bacterium]